VADGNFSSSHNNNNDVVDASSSSGDAGYCYCTREEDFDDMIGCDNKYCPIGWFHYLCLKLTEEDVPCPRASITVQNAIRRSLRLRRQRNKITRELD